MQKNKMQSQKIGMGRRTKIITEYRQTGGDADGTIQWGWVLNILPCHTLFEAFSGPVLSLLCTYSYKICSSKQIYAVLISILQLKC